MTDIHKAIAITLLMVASSAFLCGLVVGNSTGQDAACKSVGLEWVKDKCMKVTREEVR